MSIHIGAEKGKIADTVLLPGDPCRAKWIANNFLDRAVQYTDVRNMLGFTGIAPNGKLISVQGTGMGMASTEIYATELIDNYGVQNLIRVGSCGSLLPNVKLKDIVLVKASSSDSPYINTTIFNGMSFAPSANWDLLHKAFQVANELGTPIKVGDNLSVDRFYGDNWKVFAKHGVMTIEMESFMLYTIAAEKNVKALSILTVSDLVFNKDHPHLSVKEKEEGFSEMAKIAIKVASAI